LTTELATTSHLTSKEWEQCGTKETVLQKEPIKVKVNDVWYNIEYINDEWYYTYWTDSKGRYSVN